MIIFLLLAMVPLRLLGIGDRSFEVRCGSFCHYKEILKSCTKWSVPFRYGRELSGMGLMEFVTDIDE